MAKACTSIALIFVFATVIAMAFSTPLNTSGNESSGIPDDNLESRSPTDAHNSLPALIGESHDLDTEDFQAEPVIGDDDERPTHLREKRGLGRRLKKLGRSVDKSFRKVRDPALNTFGTALGGRLATGK